MSAVQSRVIAVGWNPPETSSPVGSALVTSLCEVTPRLEVTSPNLCLIPARGPSRYYGGELNVCRRLRSHARRVLTRITPDPWIGIGVADTRFAAELASRRDLLIPPGRTIEFLANLPINALSQLGSESGTGSTASDATELERLCQTLQRLGMDTLGAFAALPADAVTTRFGKLGALAHRISRGEQPGSFNFHQPPEPLVTTLELDPPAERVDIALFTARSLVADFMSLLVDRGLACSRLRIWAETEHGEHLDRHWRALTIFDSDMIIERLRWQLTGWLAGNTGETQPTAGISLLRLHADQVATADDLQLGLWGEMSDADRRAARGLDRIRGLLGPESVRTGTLTGGREPGRRFEWRSGDRVETTDSDHRPRHQPWPGRIPPPAPAIVHSVPLAACCRGADGRPIVVTGRGALSASPAQLQHGDKPWQSISGWAGPWLSDESWWNPDGHRRIARFQLLLADGSAHLCVIDQGQWWIEADYD